MHPSKTCLHFSFVPVCAQDQAKAMDHMDERVNALQKRSLQVMPLSLRREPQQRLLPIEALCEFDTDEVFVRMKSFIAYSRNKQLSLNSPLSIALFLFFLHLLFSHLCFALRSLTKHSTHSLCYCLPSCFRIFATYQIYSNPFRGKVRLIF